MFCDGLYHFHLFCLPWQKNDVHLWIDWIEGTSLFFTRGWRRSRCGSNQDLSKLFSLKDCHRKICRGGWPTMNRFVILGKKKSTISNISMIGPFCLWLDWVVFPLQQRRALFVEYRLYFGCDFSGNCGLTHFGWFWPFCGIWKFLLVRGRNSGSPLSRLPCHLNSWALYSCICVFVFVFVLLYSYISIYVFVFVYLRISLCAQL